MARHLLDAICSGDERLAKDIITNGRYGCLDSQTSKRDGTALFFCCSRGLLELANLLVRRGARLDSKTKLLATPLHAAVDNNHIHIVSYLLTLGADVNTQTHRGDTPLHLAAYRGYTDIVHLLVQWGADVTQVNEFNMTPLKEAMLQGHCDIERYLKAVQNISCPSQSYAPASRMVNIPPPTDLPSILPSQYDYPRPPPLHTTSPKDILPDSYSRLSQCLTAGQRSSANACSENIFTSTNFATKYGQRSHVPGECLETDGSALPELCNRVPHEGIVVDPRAGLSMAVPNLCVPPQDRAPHRRNSSTSSISMISDCSTSGPRSEDSGCTMSSISDVSSCGGDARREEFEAPEMDALNRCCLMAERRKSQPASSGLRFHDSGESLISRAYSNPPPDSIGEFSDLFNSSLFSLGSLEDVSSSPNSDSRQRHGESVPSSSNAKSVHYTKDPLLQSFNCHSRPHLNNLSEPALAKDPAVRKETSKSSTSILSSSSSRSADTRSAKQKLGFPIILPTERDHLMSEDCASTSWSKDNHPTNDLSMVRSSLSPTSTSASSTPLPLSSMTFINIPVQD